MSIHDKELAFLDTETTGLDSSVYEIIEIAVLVDPPLSARSPLFSGTGQLPTPVCEYQKLIRPRDINRYEPKAMEINKIPFDALTAPGVPFFQDIAGELNDVLRNRVLVGKNTAFDMGFLESEYRRSRVRSKFGYWHLDISTMAYCSIGGEISSMGLKALCEKLGIENNTAHRAMSDVLATRECFYKLLDRR
jgi:DNA polymerase III epsilon subunit-like protein